MRGKKNHQLDELRMLEYLQAVVNQNGGRDMMDDDDDDEGALNYGELRQKQQHEMKRVPAAGFLGMRGKRNPRLDALEYDDSADAGESGEGTNILNYNTG